MTSRQARNQWLQDNGWSNDDAGEFVAPDGESFESQFDAVVHETERQAARAREAR